MQRERRSFDDLYQFMLSVNTNNTHNNTSSTCEAILEWEESFLRRRNKKLGLEQSSKIRHIPSTGIVLDKVEQKPWGQ